MMKQFLNIQVDMKNRLGLYIRCFLILAGLVSGATAIAYAENKVDFNALPVKGMVTMIDLGAKKCIPCKMMAPIMEKLEKKYDGKAAIVFIDVWENPEQARRFGIRGIPTQIFYDANGKEVTRHVGFMPGDAIVQALSQLGVKP
jgi:thioredoxin 1